MKRTEQLGVRLTEQVKAALARAAEDDARSLTSLVEKVLSDWLRANGYLKEGRRK